MSKAYYSHPQQKNIPKSVATMIVLPSANLLHSY